MDGSHSLLFRSAVWHSDAARGPSTPSLDYLVSTQQKRLWNRQAERLGGCNVDDEIELRRLLDRDVARLRATQNLIDITSGAPEKVQKVRSIGHQTSRFDPLSGIVNCRE